MAAVPGYIYPEVIWTEPLTGDELIQISAGSVYATFISLTTLAAFINGGTVAPGGTAPLGEFQLDVNTLG